MKALKTLTYLLIVIFAIYKVNSIISNEKNNQVVSQKNKQEILLKEYILKSEQSRNIILSELSNELNISDEDKKYFKNCLGDYAFIKNPKLELLQIASWCKDESLLKREKFKSHYNETKNEEVKVKIKIECQNQLIAKYNLPENVSFPFIENFYTNHKRGEWSVRSSVSLKGVTRKWSCRAKIMGNIFKLQKIELK